jgi:hypothetical protein
VSQVKKQKESPMFRSSSFDATRVFADDVTRHGKLRTEDCSSSSGCECNQAGPEESVLVTLCGGHEDN